MVLTIWKVQEGVQRLASIMCRVQVGIVIRKMFLSKTQPKSWKSYFTNRRWFLKSGGTVNGMILQVIWISWCSSFAENAQTERDTWIFKSLLKVTNIDVKSNKISVEIGNIFDK